MGILAAWLPLVGNLHFESAFLAAWIGIFFSIWNGKKVSATRDEDIFRLLLVLFYVYLSAVPLLLKDIWTGCFSVDGLGFWLSIPSASVFFGFALVRFFRRMVGRFPGLLAGSVVILVGVGGFLLEFYSYPQVYFYNHVWGYWPGPIYDEQVTLNGSLIFFRGLTILWGLLLWFLPDYRDSTSARRLIWLILVGLLLGYLNMGQMGLRRPPSALQQHLDESLTSQHFRLHYEGERWDDRKASYYRARHEFFYRQAADPLQLGQRGKRSRIESYLYSHPWQKKELVGAKYTSYVPVWLEEDQLHIAAPQLSPSLHHELVHVLAKSFGNRLLNASWSIGLVEGLAVAVAGRVSPHSTVDQLVAAETPYPSSRQLQESLSFTGFYGGRQTVNYVTMGSFIGYLLRNYEVSYLKKAYRTADLENAYPVAFDSLITGWHRHLQDVTTDSVDQARRSSLFRVPSVFEKQCPHTRSKAETTWDQHRYLLAVGDTAHARSSIRQACTPECPDLRIWTEWAYDEIRQSNVLEVIQQDNRVDSASGRYFPAALRMADAHFETGNREQAGQWIRRSVFPEGPLGTLYYRRARALRSDSSRWARTTDILYNPTFPDPKKFGLLAGPLKAIVLNRLMQREQWDSFASYARRVDMTDVGMLDFGTFAKITRRLFFLGEEKTGNALLAKLEQAASRPRHHQTVRGLEEWREFIQDFGNSK